MKRKFAFYPTILLLSVAAITLYSACGDNSKSPLTGNDVYIRLGNEPNGLNPLTTEDASAIQVTSQIFQSLLEFDPQTLELTPLLAKTRPNVVVIDTGRFKGGSSYTYEIRDEATWKDGSPVMATDVTFTLKAVLNKKSGANNLRSTVDFIKDIVIDAANPRKFTVFSDKRYILAESNSGTLPIFPEKFYDTEGVLKDVSVADLSKALKDSTVKLDAAVLSKFGVNFQQAKFSREPLAITGSGAYELVEWKSAERIVLKKKTNWWGDKSAATTPILTNLPERLFYKIVNDEVATTALVKDGQFDVAARLQAKQFVDMQNDPKLQNIYTFLTAPTNNLAYLGFNCKDVKLSDRRTRRAIAHLIQPDYLIKTIMNGFADPCPTPFLPSKSYFDSSIKSPEYSIEKAKTLLAEAGWKDTNGDSTLDKRINGKQTELVIRFCYANAPAGKNTGLILQDEAKKVGIKVQLLPVDAKSFLDALKRRDFDMFLSQMGMTSALDDPKETWASSSSTPDGGNRVQFENKAADALIDQIRGEFDPVKRDLLYKKFQQLLAEEQPAIFLFATKDRIVLGKRFEATPSLRRPGYVVGQFKIKK
ncbi:MAG: ABC transporter substrate-binding protein [Saprospiraceae bacterium]|nr:ABC transporter substrate-binding protein [Saprospiraceae bacterium]